MGWILPHGLRALRHANFRTFVAGQGTTQVGNWLQLIATSWLLYRLSGSTFMLGVAAFALYGPLFFVAPFAGVLIDKVDTRKVLFCTNSVALAQAITMSLLVASGYIEPWHVIAGNVVLGFVSACDMPARQSLLSRLVDSREDLPSAIALNSIVMNGARSTGPIIAGLVIGSFGEVSGFVANLVLRFAVLAALLRMEFPERQLTRTRGWLPELRAGFVHAYGFLPTRALLLLLAATSITVHAYPTLMPWFARERFHGDSRLLGLLLGAGGMGSVSGLVYLAARPGVRGLFSFVARSSALAGIALIAFALAHAVWLAAPMLFLAGMGMTLTAASTNTILQSITEDGFRGRVASIYVMSFLGASPFGALANGWLGEHYGAPVALALSGGATLVATTFYACKLPAIRIAIRPVYERSGLIGERRHG